MQNIKDTQMGTMQKKQGTFSRGASDAKGPRDPVDAGDADNAKDEGGAVGSIGRYS